jgi:hypothetical protein
MDDESTKLVWKRARNRCEYCLLHQDNSRLTFEVDHIIAKKHGGDTVPVNLALSCYYCNVYKGSNIAGHDPKSKRITPLFNPRRHKWQRHFRWNGPVLMGRTAIGRTTIVVLKINQSEAVAIRASLAEVGLFPPV